MLWGQLRMPASRARGLGFNRVFGANPGYLACGNTSNFASINFILWQTIRPNRTQVKNKKKSLETQVEVNIYSAPGKYLEEGLD